MNMGVKSKKRQDDWSVQTEPTQRGQKMQRRRYVRLDITSSIDIKLLVPASENSNEPGLIPFRGEVINVSAGGMLIESADALPEDQYVILEFELNSTAHLTGIVGKIKRCDTEDESQHFIGIEFCTKDDIEQNCPSEYQSLLNLQCVSFDERIRDLINKHVFKLKTAQFPVEDDK
jgi:c-di-GMP-binding flagellar brake protein YcgR